MKSEDLQNIVLSKYNSGDQPQQIFRDLNGSLVWRTVQRWEPSRADADARGGIKRKRKFPTKIMVWLGAYSAG